MRISRNRKPNLAIVAVLAAALLAIGAMQFTPLGESNVFASAANQAPTNGIGQDNGADSAQPVIGAPMPLAAGAGDATAVPDSGENKAASAHGQAEQTGAPGQIGAAKAVTNNEASPAAASQGNGLLSSPFFYYLAGAVAAIALLLNLFKVSFAPEMAYDSAIFKTLSSETRMELLASLQQRRKTLTELATERKISLPGVKQHLELLEDAGLVKKIDEGRKWKYYELTVNGKTILAERYS